MFLIIELSVLLMARVQFWTLINCKKWLETSMTLLAFSELEIEGTFSRGHKFHESDQAWCETHDGKVGAEP